MRTQDFRLTAGLGLALGLGFGAATQAQTALATATEIVETTVAACTESAAGGALDLREAFSWPTGCASTAHDACVEALLNDDDPANDKNAASTCHDIEARVWSEAADALQQRLIDRWQGCALPDAVKTSMIDKVRRIDRAMAEVTASHCDYDASQWKAVGQPAMSDLLLPSCLAEGQTTRATVFYHLLWKDVGCAQ